MSPGMRASWMASWISETRFAIGSIADFCGLCTTTTWIESKSRDARAMTSRWPLVTGSNDPGTTAILLMIPHPIGPALPLRYARRRDWSALGEEVALAVVEAASDRL